MLRLLRYLVFRCMQYNIQLRAKHVLIVDTIFKANGGNIEASPKCIQFERAMP